MQISFKTHKILKWLERELVAVLAVGFLGLGSWLANAETSAVIGTSLEIVSSGETITVTSPNGGESWEIGSVHNVTWTASGSIANVMIELQRTVAGSWETIVASTINDGSYPWTVAGSTTNTATVRISKVGDASINDLSDTVFSIATASGGSGGGGGLSNWPGIDNVTPNVISNDNATVVTVTGANFDSSIGVKLNTTVMSQVVWSNASQLRFTVPAKFPTGVYSLTVYDSQGRYGTWGSYVWVISGPIENQIPGEITPPVVTPPEPTPPTPPVNLYYSSKLVNQSEQNITLKVGEEITVWAEFLNNGTLPWENFGKNPTRIGTSIPRDRLSKFKALLFSGWVIKNRPANVTHVGQSASVKQTVLPGEVGSFTFKLKAPSRSGKYVEAFGTVVEFRQWMQEGAVKWNITVVPKTTAPVVSKPIVPTVVLPMPTLPEAPTTFCDGFETFLRGVLNLFDRLIDSIGRI